MLITVLIYEDLTKIHTLFYVSLILFSLVVMYIFNKKISFLHKIIILTGAFSIVIDGNFNLGITHVMMLVFHTTIFSYVIQAMFSRDDLNDRRKRK